MTIRTLKTDTERESVKISFLTDKANRDALDTIATALDRDRSYILNEAITAYLETRQLGNEEFACAFKSSWSAHMRMLFQPSSSFPNTFCHVRRCNRIILRDVVNGLM